MTRAHSLFAAAVTAAAILVLVALDAARSGSLL